VFQHIYYVNLKNWQKKSKTATIFVSTAYLAFKITLKNNFYDELST